MPRLTKRAIDAFSATGEEAFLWDSDVKGFGVRLRGAGAKSYVLSYRVGGRPKRFTISKVDGPFTVDQARDRASRLLRGLADGVDPAQAKLEEREAVTVAELVDAYLAEGPTLKPNKKASSWVTDGRVIARHVKPLLGGKLARSITSADVARFQSDVAAGKTAKDEKTGPRGRARVTGGKRVAALSTAVLGAAYGFGIETGRVKDNPARGVALLKTDGRERFLSAREVTAIAEALTVLEDEGALNPAMADAARVLMLTGCRKNEVLALQWSWVDWGKRCLRLPDSKTGAKVVPLASAALEVLERRRSAAAQGAKTAGRKISVYAFPASRGEGHSVGLPKAWETVKAKAAEIARQHADEAGEDPDQLASFGDVRLHDLRHSFASFAIADGGTLFMLGKVLGHRQARTTEGYAHLSDDPLQSLAERTGSKIAEAMKPRARGGNVVQLPTKAG